MPMDRSFLPAVSVFVGSCVVGLLLDGDEWEKGDLLVD